MASLDQVAWKTLWRVCRKWDQPVSRLTSPEVGHKLGGEGGTAKRSASEPVWRMVPSSQVPELENC